MDDVLTCLELENLYNIIIEPKELVKHFETDEEFI